ncbi:nucleoside monophosphate kinase [uncultured Tenacibaculum sp.]|uniref:nucleoside monophosphate kinase n=1 Tax=uncultured Tenacibaculum sp. TaxID=174713 RepID=UPI0026302E01|nr:nucleoside monophosphate kinase [uncultured Tenacibaculum sp.]
MRKLNILFLDPPLSSNIIEKALSFKLNSSILNLRKALKEQIRDNDDLGKEMVALLTEGKMLTTEILGKFISKNLKSIEGDVLLSYYPRTVEQYTGLKEVLIKEDIVLEGIWYFMQRNSDQFMKSHFENSTINSWVEKFGDEIKRNWKPKLDKLREMIAEIQHITSEELTWKIVKVDYISELKEAHIIELIKDFD